MAEITITEENFQKEVIESDKTVVLDFWAAWCGPCKAFAPTLAEFAEEHPEIKVGKVNVDEQQALASQFGIMSIPTIAVMKDGKVIDSAFGALPKEDLEKLCDIK
jgi:thioredoxin 1